MNQGDVVGRLIGVDQHGDTVDLYDFAYQGRPIVLDVFAEWCPPCQTVAQWLGGGNDAYGLEPYDGSLRAAVNSGDVYWISVMEQDNSGQNANLAAVQRWHSAFPNDAVPVIANPANNGMMAHLAQAGFPNFPALDEAMTIVYMNDRQTQSLDFAALDAVMSLAR